MDYTHSKQSTACAVNDVAPANMPTSLMYDITFKPKSITSPLIPCSRNQVHASQASTQSYRSHGYLSSSSYWVVHVWLLKLQRSLAGTCSLIPILLFAMHIYKYSTLTLVTEAILAIYV